MVNDYADARNIFAKTKNFANPFFLVHMGPRWSFLFKIGSKILCHCPFKLFSLAKGSLAVGAGPVGLPGVRFIEDEVSIVESDIDDKISNGICHI